MIDYGFIKLYRTTVDKGWYKKSEYTHLWIHLLMKATHKGIEYFFGGENIKLEPGQFITGRKKLAEETGINESKIERILNFFEKKEQQIEQQKTNRNRIITILNWHLYQSTEQQLNNNRTTTEQQLNNNRTTTEQQLNTYKNDKNIKNDNNDKNYSENSDEFTDNQKTKPRAKSISKKSPIYTRVVDEFYKTYESITGEKYVFKDIDGSKAKSLIRIMQKKYMERNNSEGSDDQIIDGWAKILEEAETYWKTNDDFSFTSIESNFNSIIQSRNKKSKKPSHKNIDDINHE